MDSVRNLKYKRKIKPKPVFVGFLTSWFGRFFIWIWDYEIRFLRHRLDVAKEEVNGPISWRADSSLTLRDLRDGGNILKLR
jgi:hypothetical protein